MRRYYICPVKTYDQLDGETGDVLRTIQAAKVWEYLPGFSYVAHIPTDPLTGTPLFNWAIVCVEAKNNSKFRQDLEFSEVPHSENSDEVKPVPLNFKAKALLKGVDLDSNESLKSICNKIGKKLSPRYDFEKEKV